MTPQAATAAISSAQRMLQRRALQCSFTSVFHLRQSGLMAPAEATQVERLFLVSAGLPLLLLFIGGVTFRSTTSTTLVRDERQLSPPSHMADG
jgi:hypothetical protein